MNTKRLLLVAKALRESKRPDVFTMSVFGRDCGTPCCALGHYAVRHDLQTVFSLNVYGYLSRIKGRADGVDGIEDHSILKHFAITSQQSRELFQSSDGCGGAMTAIEASEYIEAFVERHS